MGKHEEVYKTAVEKDDSDLVCCAVANMLDILERTNSKMYNEFIEKLENIAYHIPYAEAESIVRNMSPKGQHWGYNEVESVCVDHGVTEDITDYYMVMNMMYNDYYSTASRYGLQNDLDFYWSLTCDFINDPDAKPHKVARYFTC